MFTSEEEGLKASSKFGKLVVVYTCGYPECGKEFMRTWNLLDHVRMHYGIKPYVCHLCGKAFTQIGNMRKHVQQHYHSALNQRKQNIEVVTNFANLGPNLY